MPHNLQKRLVVCLYFKSYVALWAEDFDTTLQFKQGFRSFFTFSTETAIRSYAITPYIVLLYSNVYVANWVQSTWRFPSATHDSHVSAAD